MPYDESDPRVDDAVEHAARRPGAGRRSTGSTRSTPSAATPPSPSTSCERLRDRLPLVIGFVLLLTMLMMAIAFRSVPLALVVDACSTWPRSASPSGC